MRVIPLREIQPALSHACADYLLGVTTEQVAILDAAKILSDQRIAVYDEVEA